MADKREKGKGPEEGMHAPSSKGKGKGRAAGAPRPESPVRQRGESHRLWTNIVHETDEVEGKEKLAQRAADEQRRQAAGTTIFDEVAPFKEV